MRYIVQYLEPGPHLAEIAPKEAAERLHAAFAGLPIEAVLLGWDLPPALVEACAQEALRAGAALYLWHPLLTAQGAPPDWVEWRAIGTNGHPIPGDVDLPEFTFLCPNHPEARAWVLERLARAMETGPFAGAFLDRIRWPSPTGDLCEHWGCFCPFCRQKAEEAGLDLENVQGLLRASPADALLRAFYQEGQEEALAAWARWRKNAIADIVSDVAKALHQRGHRVGLDLWSPALAPLVGQAFEMLTPCADWSKVMIYCHTRGPAGLPYEISHLAGQMAIGEEEALARLSAILAIPLPRSLEASRKGLGLNVLRNEVMAACALTGKIPLWVGLDLVEVPNVCHRQEADVRAEIRALREADISISGLVLSWDLWRIPLERLTWLVE